jgi:hypothetical protein
MITITTPNAEKLYFKGTTTEITSVLCRLEFTAPISGKTLEVALYPYGSEADFDAGKSIISIEGVDGFGIGAKVYDLSNEDDPETWKTQSLAVAHDEVKAYLDGLGYLATISGI